MYLWQMCPNLNRQTLVRIFFQCKDATSLNLILIRSVKHFYPNFFGLGAAAAAAQPEKTSFFVFKPILFDVSTKRELFFASMFYIWSLPTSSPSLSSSSSSLSWLPPFR